MCLQEMKYRPAPMEEQFFRIEEYQPYWTVAERNGYSGVATLTRLTPRGTPEEGLRDPYIDREGRVLRLDFADFQLVNAYFPHSHRELKRLQFKLHFLGSMDRYLEVLESEGKPIVLCGDLNISHTPNDLANPRQNEKNAGFLLEERAFIDRLLARGYRDAFREFCGEPGHYTWWSQRSSVRERNIGWRLDYFLVSPGLHSALKDCRHLPYLRGSDHCPVLLDLGL